MTLCVAFFLLILSLTESFNLHNAGGGSLSRPLPASFPNLPATSSTTRRRNLGDLVDLDNLIDCSSFRRSFHTPEAFRARVDNDDVISPAELEKLFTPSKVDTEKILRSTLSKGFVSAILSIESALVDVTTLYERSFALLTQEMVRLQWISPSTPSPARERLRALIGTNFVDAFSELGLGMLSKDRLWKAEETLYEIMDRLLDKERESSSLAQHDLSLSLNEGAYDFLLSLLADGNELAVVTSLPRHVAQKVLSLAGLAPLLEAKVSLDRFFTSNYDLDRHHGREREQRDDEVGEVFHNLYSPSHGERHQLNQYLRCCAVMQCVPAMAVVVDSNYHNMLTAKRAGISSIAVKGYAPETEFLRGADMIVDSLAKLDMPQVYKMVKKAIKSTISDDRLAESSVRQRMHSGGSRPTPQWR